MSAVNEASPASKASDLERLVSRLKCFFRHDWIQTQRWRKCYRCKKWQKLHRCGASDEPVWKDAYEINKADALTLKKLKKEVDKELRWLRSRGFL